jgi:uncharacterized membrane protein YqgA involved in biofilm formation
MDVVLVKSLLLGAIAFGSAVGGLFFLRFWQRTSDRLFLYFSFAFFLQALDRILIGINASTSDENPVIYLIRLVAYGLIILAIIDKNRKKSSSLTSQVSINNRSEFTRR